MSETHATESSYSRLWHHRSFLLLWSGRAVSTLGNHFFELAIMWDVYVASGSSLSVAGVSVAFQLAPVLIGPVAGVLVDRWDRRTTMVVSDFIRAGLVGVVVVLALRGSLNVWPALLAVFALEMVGAFFGPARSAFIPQMLGRDELLTANGIMSGTNSAIGIGGKALAGFVVAVAGTLWAFVVDAVSFVVSAFCVLAIRPAPGLSEDRPSQADPVAPAGGWRRFMSDVRGGWAVVAERPTILHLVLFGTVANATFAMIAPVLPAYVHAQLHAGAWALGLVESAAFAGGDGRRIPGGRGRAADSCRVDVCHGHRPLRR